MTEWLQTWELLIGAGIPAHELGTGQIIMRSLIVFVASLFMIRVGARRFLARKTAFDLILAFIFGSMLSRAINGSALIGPSLAGGITLILFHRLLAILAYRSTVIGFLIKGSEETIIDDGRVRSDAMRRNHLSNGDLLEDLRLQACQSPQEVSCAKLERSGELSVIPKKPQDHQER